MRQVIAMRRCHAGIASFSFSTAITDDRDSVETTIRDTVRFGGSNASSDAHALCKGLAGMREQFVHGSCM